MASVLIAAHIVDAIKSYSEVLQMPLALMCKPDATELRLSTIKQLHDYHVCYRLEVKRELAMDGYALWVDKAKSM